MKHKYHRHHSHWGLRRRLTFVFAFVALAAVFMTTWFTLGAIYSELFGSSSHGRMFEQPWKNGGLDNPEFQQARDIFQRVARTAFLAGTLSFVLAAIVAGVVTRFLTRPLQALTEGAKRLEAGERGLRLKVSQSRDELQTLTEAFNNLVTGLERQEAWRRGVVADIAHDLRTPLSVLRSEIEAMQDGISKLDQEGLARLHHQIMLLSRLVEDLRTLSLAESGGLELYKEAVNLKDFLHKVADGFRQRASEANTQINLEVDPGLHFTLDVKQMTRVLNNLLENALQYGHGPIEVNAQKQTNVTIISVKDHGPGIKDEALERIFERFYKSDASRTRKENVTGSGLGLSIAKAIVEAHGGSLEARNHSGGGAVLEIRLPV
jgi:two-component system sensor histidine kinase BaeS